MKDVSPLYIACQNGNELEHDADPNQVAIDGHTPTSVARVQGHTAIIELIAAYQINSHNSWFPQFAALLATFVDMVTVCAWLRARGGADAKRAKAEARADTAR